jgi:alkylation response protein AidB-like acyl-CoA dehydrogenase
MSTVADGSLAGLSDTQRQIVALARDFAREHIAPHATEWDRAK